MAEDPIRVLVADSHEDRRKTTIERLEELDRLRVEGAPSVEIAEKVVESDNIDCIVSERRLEDGIAMDLFRYAGEKQAEVGRIILTTEEQAPLLLDATELVFGHINLLDRDPYERLADLIIEGYDRNAFAPYPVPEDEDERLAVLEKYREKTEASLDEFVERAAEDFGVEKASIRFIDRDTQKYVACHGFVADEVDREDTICTYNIMDDDVMVVEDVQEDPRFRDTDMFEAMNINWYAGAVIKVEGENIGTFCLEDSERQEFTREDKQRLKEYAVKAASFLTLQDALERKDTSVGDAIRAARKRSMR